MMRHPVRVAIAEPVAVADLGAPDAVMGLRMRTFAMAPKGGPSADMVFEFPGRVTF